jgi:hypothetical protein
MDGGAGWQGAVERQTPAEDAVRSGMSTVVLGVKKAPNPPDRVRPDRSDGRRGYLEPDVEPVFHEDSYGYRPGRSAHQALRVCRERCWRNDWILDLDIRSFFDSVGTMQIFIVSRDTIHVSGLVSRDTIHVSGLCSTLSNAVEWNRCRSRRPRTTGRRASQT